MELGLSLGENSRPFSFREEPREASNLGFNSTLLSIGPVITKQTDQHQEQELLTVQRKKHKSDSTTEEDHTNKSLLSPSASLKANNKLDFLPHFSSGGSSRGFDVNMPAEDEVEEVAALSSSPNSVALMDFCMFSKKGRRSDEDENRGRTRKRLRLSKEQSSFLEESFKDHNTLNPKQKIALAKQLHLCPRQVEVWFQNRRARTKLKKIEIGCKYWKKCCDTLTEENTRLHKELEELRALKTSCHHQHCQNH